jgi:hypothetical protein
MRQHSTRLIRPLSTDEKLDSTVDTGIAMNIAIYILLALAGAAGIYYVGHRKADNEA